ncbi:unnamed protein product [Cyclocybe aegerita]|uniref:L-serine ammonia-lyase n=1 Tax=Cyclocybe aegerita TaxID=1973307 RepID=A0A8S0VR29_CYCAE|nr:unnamed protein product [Cyclocybe aegerita]
MTEMVKDLWQETPLIYSTHLSQITGASVYLKLENVHPSFSFKYRGISRFIQKVKAERGPSVHLVIASSGNAGLAAACVSRSLGFRCTVFLPDGAADNTLGLLNREKAEVVVGGRIYAEALKEAKELVKTESEAVMVPSYDDPVLWEGHSSMIHEVKRQLTGRQPDAIFCSVGGGGLLGGIFEGGWLGKRPNYHPRDDGVETALPDGVHIVHNQEFGLDLAHFSSVALQSKASSSLGASEPAVRVLNKALKWPGGVRTISVPDELSMDTLLKFTDSSSS